jgi:hypothetical protein
MAKVVPDVEVVSEARTWSAGLANWRVSFDGSSGSCWHPLSKFRGVKYGPKMQ